MVCTTLLVSDTGVPVSVEDSGCVSAEERQLVGGSAALVDGDDGKGAAAAGLPVDRDVFGVCLEGVRRRVVVVAWAWSVG